MSNFNCEHCGTPILEGENGQYITGCIHYPEGLPGHGFIKGLNNRIKKIRGKKNKMTTCPKCNQVCEIEQVKDVEGKSIIVSKCCKEKLNLIFDAITGQIEEETQGCRHNVPGFTMSGTGVIPCMVDEITGYPRRGNGSAYRQTYCGVCRSEDEPKEIIIEILLHEFCVGNDSTHGTIRKKKEIKAHVCPMCGTMKMRPDDL